MTRAEALLKLLRLEPETRSRLLVVTGWTTEETEATLDKLVEEGLVTYRNGAHGAQGERLYYPRAATKGNARVLPGSSGEGRRVVRTARSGLVRADGAVALGRAWFTDAQGSRAEAN